MLVTVLASVQIGKKVGTDLKYKIIKRKPTEYIKTTKKFRILLIK